MGKSKFLELPPRSFKEELTRKWTIEETVIASIIGAIFGALAAVMGPLMFGPFQLRLCDSLDLIVYDRKYGGRAAMVGLLISPFIVNMFSPYGGIVDSMLGLISGIITFSLVWWFGIKFKGSNWGKFIAGMTVVLIAQFFVAYILLYVMFGVPFWEAQGGVFVGDFVSIVVIGIPLLKALEMTYRKKVSENAAKRK